MALNTEPESITKMRCFEKIVISKYVDTYCMLPRGHEGEHSTVNQKLIRCQAMDVRGLQCSQPIDHFGSHFVVNGGVNTWQKE
jgi:hypothetical protein